MSQFVNLHNHSDYSLLDGMSKIPNMVDRVLELGMDTCALTDHGNMSGSVLFFEECKARGVKPIFGLEGYIVEDRHERTDRGNYHLILLAKDQVGYRNLMKICSEAYISGFSSKPRFDFDLLAQHREGLVVATSCLKGIVTYRLHRSNREFEAGNLDAAGMEKDTAVQHLKFLHNTFGDDFYVEVMTHGIPEQDEVRPQLENLANDHGIKVIATNDSHYLYPEDHEAHDVLLCIQTKKTVFDENRALKYKTPEFYLKGYDDMAKLFPKEWLDNTLEIAEKCNVELDLGNTYFPGFKEKEDEGFDSWTSKRPSIEGESRADLYLKYLCLFGLKKEFEEHPEKAAKKQEYMERLKYELGILKDKKFADYFLVTWDFVNFAKSNDIPVGPARGSAAGSLVAFLMRITEVDPIKHGLIFERFINPHRKDFPDIDLDFSDERRQEVIDYIVDTYGQEFTCLIGTYSKMNAKVCIRDVSRAFGLSVADTNRIAEKIPDLAMQKKPMLAEYRKTLPQVGEMAEEFPDVFRVAEKLETCNRHVGVHAAGIIISSKEVSEIVPLHSVKKKGRTKERVIVSQYDMRDLAKCGLVKMDILGLKQLSIIDKAVKQIMKRHGIKIELPT